MRPADRDPEVEEAGTRALLDVFSLGDPDQVFELGQVFAGLGKRSFGMLLFVAILPAFIPIPGVGGAVSGPLVILVGAQLLLGRRTPWLPGFLAHRGPHRHTMVSFRNKLSPWLARVERVIRPRSPALLDHRLANAFTGLLLIALGLLLALPVPFTNYLFGVLLLLFALALLERDGRLMAFAWSAGVLAVTVFGLLSGRMAAIAAPWVDLLF